MSAFPGLEVLHQFVPDFKTRQLNDADEVVADFPDLTLSKFQ
jgi:hypothetical protein